MIETKIADVVVPAWDWVRRNPTRLFAAKVIAVGAVSGITRRALRVVLPPAAALYGLGAATVYVGERLRRPADPVRSVFGPEDNSRVGEALGVIAHRFGL